MSVSLRFKTRRQSASASMQPEEHYQLRLALQSLTTRPRIGRLYAQKGVSLVTIDSWSQTETLVLVLQ
jgi:hypothetical protein